MSVRVQSVLVVEDDSDLRQMFRTALSVAGYDVVQASDGLEALRQLEANDIECVVLDLSLPLIDGYAVLESPYAFECRSAILRIAMIIAAEPSVFTSVGCAA